MNIHALNDTGSPETEGLRSIEKTVAAHAAVSRAAVLISVDDAGHERLIAYVEPAERNRPPVGEDILEDLVAELPEFAIPDAVVVFDRLPLSDAGEVDVEALPAIAVDAVDPQRSVRAWLLTELFANVLGLTSLPMHENFFDAGGHSLLVTRVVSHIRSVTDIDVTVRDVFDAQTIGSLIDRLDRHSDPRPKLRPADAAAREAVTQPPAGPHRTQSVATRLSGPLDLGALRAACADVVRRHNGLRSAGEEVAVSEASAENPDGSKLAFTAVHAMEETLPVLLADEASRLSERPAGPLQVALFQLQPNDHVLMLSMPADRCDRRSAQIVRRDVLQAYASRINRRAPIWEALAVQPADHAAWQANLLGDAADPQSRAGRQLAFWRDALEGLPTSLGLPMSRPRTADGSGRYGEVEVAIGRDDHQALRAMARTSKVTMLMVLQAATAVLIRRLGGTADVPVGMSLTGRADAAVSNVVGVFANSVVIRVNAADGQTFADLVAGVRAASLSAGAHSDVPFGHVVRACAPAMPDPAAHPLFQVAVDLRPAPIALPAVPGCSAADVPVAGDCLLDMEFSGCETFDAHGTPAGIEVVLRYAAEVFDDAAARAIAAQFLELISAVAADPAIAIESVARPSS